MARWETAFRTTVHSAGYAMVWIVLAFMGISIIACFFVEIGKATARLLGLSFEYGLLFAVACMAVGAGLSWLTLKASQKNKSHPSLGL